jgi:D-3-phosphoglycerate dehydrogenase / 2-oxoglutarate reductase
LNDTGPLQRPGRKYAILNAEPGRFSPRAKAALRALGEVAEHEADRAYLLANAGLYDVLFIALRNVIDREILSRAARLRCIVTPTTGLNHVDVGAARERRVAVLSLQGETAFLENIGATAELAWGLLLALVRRIPAAHGSVLRGDWNRDAFYGAQLRDKTLGVAGYGRLGKMVAAYGRAFGMRVVAFDRDTTARTAEVEFMGLEELLRQSDVISIHLSLNDQTRRLFDSSRLRGAKPGALLINTARGEIVDEAALVEALESGRLAGAAVDVMAGEATLDAAWLARSPLAAYARTHSNVLITPHIGGVTHESVEATNLFMIEKLQRYLDGKA